MCYLLLEYCTTISLNYCYQSKRLWSMLGPFLACLYMVQFEKPMRFETSLTNFLKPHSSSIKNFNCELGAINKWVLYLFSSLQKVLLSNVFLLLHFVGIWESVPYEPNNALTVIMFILAFGFWISFVMLWLKSLSLFHLILFLFRGLL